MVADDTLVMILAGGEGKDCILLQETEQNRLFLLAGAIVLLILLSTTLSIPDFIN